MFMLELGVPTQFVMFMFVFMFIYQSGVPTYVYRFWRSEYKGNAAEISNFF